MKKTPVMILFMLPFLSVVEIWASSNTSIKDRYDQLSEIYSNVELGSIKERREVAESLYLENFKPIIANLGEEQLRQLDLEYLFRAVTVVNFYDPQVNYTRDLRRLLEFLERKEFVKKRHYADLQKAYVAAGQFELARSMVDEKKLKYLEYLPKINRVNDLALEKPFILEFENSSLKQRAFEIPSQGPFILVISNPGCRFSRTAANYISDDVQFKKMFFKHSVWLTQPGGSLQVEQHKNWMQTYPKLPVGLIYNSSSWSFLDANLGTPAFYFFHDGQLSQSILGWSLDDNQQALKDALTDIGLI
ncbi:hypothetical protein ACJJJB_12085 [Microbulbifer sp. ANSA001]|uniref:hypothetical protein n=1 Tax=Microbulbifer sp. ANSA001 TaxID=3243358 RepID=UPI0040416D0C